MQKDNAANDNLFSNNVADRERLRLQAKKTIRRSVWLGFGVFGMVGWSVAIPAFAGVSLGWWLDKKWPQHFSWALTLLITGLIAGCAIAWQWIAKENKEIYKQEDNKND